MRLSNVDEAVTERIRQQDEANRILADVLYKETRGENISLAENRSLWKKIGLTLGEASKALRRIAQKSQGYLEHVNGADRTFAWTARAKEIKASGQLFINVQPITVTYADDLQPAGPGEIQADVPEGFSDIHGPLVGPLASPSLMAAPEDIRMPAAGGAGLAIPFTDSPEVAPRPPVGKHLNLTLLILADEEIPVFQLLGEVTENYLSADIFQGLGLEESNLDLFLAKMYKLCILADGPEVMRQKKVFVFSKLAYDQHADSFFQLSTSAALGKIQADLQQLRNQQVVLKNQLEDGLVDAAVAENASRQSIEALGAAQRELVEARRRLAEAEEKEKKAKQHEEEACENQQVAEVALTAIEQEIEAADLDNRIADIQSLEETATRLDQLHSLALQQLLLSYLIIPVGKEA